ncbi:exonuclease [Oscillatoria sp. CS-180]|uniref:exonuclease n=1 Tax=Oscillatoria sp. CS-180 TaxID=3021720 RepID=UPI00233059F4|nr:exonuclease [Oscillatoria sp. CS-180]MDB9525556.1 exonuclease [Oscillatoria sp. CS-180]
MKLERYRAKTVTVNRRRVYEINGCRYPGVTTILSATKPAEARKALQQWRQRVGVETAQKISNKASSAGTRLHKQIARFLEGQLVDIPADVTGYWDSIVPVLEDVSEAWLVEGAVWHDDGYVGFPDAVMTYQGRICLCDWKTAIKPKKLEWIGDYCLQVAAYAKAFEQVYTEAGIEVEGALIAIALDSTPAQTFWLDRDAVEHHWDHFQQRLDEYYRIRPRYNRHQFR